MYRAAILTASDKGAAGEREDKSGLLIRELLEAKEYQIVFYKVLPDDRNQLAETMKQICDQHQADLLLTTGGTGFSPRDCTPEATLDIAEKLVPGIPEAIRAYSLQITKRAMLSRAVAVIRKQTLIINLPGSLKAVEESLTFIIDQLPHGLEVLSGQSGDCAR